MVFVCIVMKLSIREKRIFLLLMFVYREFSYFFFLLALIGRDLAKDDNVKIERERYW